MALLLSIIFYVFYIYWLYFIFIIIFKLIITIFISNITSFFIIYSFYKNVFLLLIAIFFTIICYFYLSFDLFFFKKIYYNFAIFFKNLFIPLYHLNMPFFLSAYLEYSSSVYSLLIFFHLDNTLS